MGGAADGAFRPSATATGAGSCRARKTTIFLPDSLAGAVTVFIRKPGLVAVTFASASAGMPSMRKNPSSSVTAVGSLAFSTPPTARAPVAASATRTVAPGTGPASLSFTTP